MIYSNKKLCLLLAGIAISTQLPAQKKLFTIAEATNGMATTLAPKNIKQASWQPNTDNFCQVVKRDTNEYWISTHMPDGATDTILSTQRINKINGSHLKMMPAMKWINENTAYYRDGNKVMMGTLNGSKFSWKVAATLPDNAENVTIDKFANIGFTVDNNLWMVTPDGRTEIVTNDMNRNLVNGQAVHRNEFGIETGIFFSPKGSYLAYYHMDQTMVNDYPIVKWDVAPAREDIIKYPMAGGTSHQVQLCVYNPATGKTVSMQTGTPKDHYLTCVTWAPDEKSVYIAILNREQSHLWLNQYNAETGEKMKTLFEESSPKYVHPEHPLTFVPGYDDEFIWWSGKDGYNHLYLYNVSGKEMRNLTPGKYDVNEIIGFNKDNGQVIITSAKESPLEKHIYTIDLATGDMNRLDADPGMHMAASSTDGKYVYDMYSEAHIPRKCVIYASDKSSTKTLVEAANTLENYNRPQIREITITAADGKTPLYGKLILPLNFDSTKKYPVIVYLYNGPNVQLIHNSFPESGNLWYEYMAQHGYVVFTMDGRGSSNRGLAFEQATFRHLGDVEIDDQLKGVAYLKALPYVDTNRMGLHGWSFGGFMTTSIMLKHPNVFKCAVAGGPVMDWKMYEVMYTERYMNTPQTNPQGYENANLLNKVSNLKGNLLLIHGTSDNVVVWQNSIDFIKKSVDEGVQVDYFVYPGHEHNVRGKDRVHLMQKISNYFDLYLKP